MSPTELKLTNNIFGFNKSGYSKWHGVDCNNHVNYEDVSYHFNNYGHRSQLDPTTLISNEYILIVGCSHTMGVGILESDIYFNKLNLTLPIYNLGLSGSGNDIICHNIQNFLKQFPSPNKIIIQWTDPNRFNIKKERVGSWYSGSLSTLLAIGEEEKYWEHLSNILRMYSLENIRLRSIPVIEFGIEFSHKVKISTEYKRYKWDYADTARDDLHGGPISHSNLASWISSNFSKILYS
jgi:hypothetical protein